MRIIRFLIIVISLFALWWLTIIIFKLPNYILPNPIRVIEIFIEQFALIWQQTQITLLETLLGLFLGVTSGMTAALLLMISKPLRWWLLPILIISQAIPTFAIAPLFVIWFGYGILSKVITASIMIFFPITTAFYEGLRRTPLEYLELAKSVGASQWKILWCVRVPAALPVLGAGLRIAAAIAPIGAVVGEWVGSSQGLGFLMLNANSRLQIDLMFAALFVITLLTLILYYTVDFMINKLIFWHKAE